MLDTVSAGAERGQSHLQGPTLGIRFGMTGGLVLDNRAAIDRLLYSSALVDDRWVRFRVGFVDGGQLSLHDPRRFGRVELDPDEDALGPDAFGLTLGALRRALSSRHDARAAREGPAARPGTPGRSGQPVGGRNPLARPLAATALELPV